MQKAIALSFRFVIVMALYLRFAVNWSLLFGEFIVFAA